ncbi:unnamed protein product [Cuscuta epithymum]|uniref:Uncharacterized protein n=1 Tax=Cuscuta epithymum TaxID=186058 RepID=A0AAV0E024_9ASTE|nr:unnamed protein product [Cuscuta epithymum]
MPVFMNNSSSQNLPSLMYVFFSPCIIHLSFYLFLTKPTFSIFLLLQVDLRARVGPFSHTDTL